MEKHNYQEDIGKVMAAAFDWKSRSEKAEAECGELRVKLDELKKCARLVVDNALVHTRQDVLEAKQYILEVTNGGCVGNPHPDGCFRTIEDILRHEDRIFPDCQGDGHYMCPRCGRFEETKE